MILIILIGIVTWICNILIILLLIRSALSWVVYFGGRRSAGITQAYRIITRLTEPVVRPVRNFISRFVPTGPIDFAPLATFLIILLILFVVEILVKLLIR